MKRGEKDSLLVAIKVLAISKPEKPVKLDPPRSILLFGPPGTGKTLLASAASNSINATFFNADISKILSRYVGDSPKTIDALFLLARKMSPSIIFFDEFDAISLSREQQLWES
jgi:ATP-dependent 26S proteasome regulatory subunit